MECLDQEQDHRSIRLNAVEEVYELVDAIEAGDDGEMLEELGDLLLQVVFHAQMAGERGAFNFDDIAQTITDKLIRRHPHVFGDAKVKMWMGFGTNGMPSSKRKRWVRQMNANPPLTESPGICRP